MREPTIGDLQERLEHANQNSAAMSAKAELLEAERDYWQARCSLAEDLIPAAQAVAEHPSAVGKVYDYLRAAGKEYAVRRRTLDVQTAKQQQESRRTGYV